MHVTCACYMCMLHVHVTCACYMCACRMCMLHVCMSHVHVTCVHVACACRMACRMSHVHVAYCINTCEHVHACLQMVESKKRSLEEAAQRRREESCMSMQHAVTSYDHLEQDMYNKAKGAETDRKKHDQILGKMHDDLTYLKRENARRLKVSA